MADLKFGDLVCYDGSSGAHDPWLFISDCRHPGTGISARAVDILNLKLGKIGHAQGPLFNRCTHFPDRVFIDGKEIATTAFEIAPDDRGGWIISFDQSLGPLSGTVTVEWDSSGVFKVK